jgi:rhodanese-related sulfurtransferase
MQNVKGKRKMRKFNLTFLFFAIYLFCILQFLGLSVAEANQVNERLLNSKTAQKQIEIPPALFTGKLKKHNPAFFISAESLSQKLKEKNGIILIDVRNSKEFEKFRIPGSINIPIFSIKTKTFLKSKPLVLVNEGYSYNQLENECQNLRDNDFTVFILAGGLNFWKQKGGTVEGNIFAQKELNIIPPRPFFAEKDFDNWILIDISQKENSESHHLIPRRINIPFSDNENSFVSELKKLIIKQKANPILSILIFNESGEHYKKVKELIKEKGIEKNIFYLEGGIKSYKSFLYKQALMWNKKGNLKQSVKGCRSCP